MLPATLPFVFAILWASSYAAAKIGLADITPYAFVAVRLAIAAAAAVVMVLALRRSWGPVAAALAASADRRRAGARARARDRAQGAGQRRGDADRAGARVPSDPDRDARRRSCSARQFRWWQWIGFALGLAGVVLGVPHDADFSVLALLGLSLFGLSGGTLYLKRFAADVPPFEATAVQLIGGAAAGDRHDARCSRRRTCA